MSLIFDAPSARRNATRFVSTASRLSQSVNPRFRTAALVVEWTPFSLLTPPLRVENPCTAHGSFASVGDTRTVTCPVTRFGHAAAADLRDASLPADFLRVPD